MIYAAKPNADLLKKNQYLHVLEYPRTKTLCELSLNAEEIAIMRPLGYEQWTILRDLYKLLEPCHT